MQDVYSIGRVISIDCGTAIVGWAVLERIDGKLVHIASDAILTSKKDDMPLRLKYIFEELQKLIERFAPDAMAIEDIFYFKNQKTVISVSQARGAIILSGILKGLEIYNYTPLQVKSAVTGYGRAEKKQVASMVGKILNLKIVPKLDDITDAIALGICHLNTRNVSKN